MWYRKKKGPEPSLSSWQQEANWPIIYDEPLLLSHLCPVWKSISIAILSFFADLPVLAREFSYIVLVSSLASESTWSSSYCKYIWLFPYLEEDLRNLHLWLEIQPSHFSLVLMIIPNCPNFVFLQLDNHISVLTYDFDFCSFSLIWFYGLMEDIKLNQHYRKSCCRQKSPAKISG